MMSGGQSVSFIFLLDTQRALLLRKLGSFCAHWGVPTPAGMAVSGHTSLRWLRGFPYDGVVPETEQDNKGGCTVLTGGFDSCRVDYYVKRLIGAVIKYVYMYVFVCSMK